MSPPDDPLIDALLNRAAHGSPRNRLCLYQRALHRSIGTNGPDHPSTAACLKALGDFYLYDPESIIEARDKYEQHLGALERRLGPEHEQVATALLTLARVSCLIVDGGSPVVSFHERASEIIRGRLEFDYPDPEQLLVEVVAISSARREAQEPVFLPSYFIEWVFNHAHRCRAMKDFQTAERLLVTLVDLTGRRRVESSDSFVQRHRCMCQLLTYYDLNGDYRRALPIWELKAEQDERPLFGVRYSLLGEDLMMLAECHEMLGNYDEAKRYYMRALKLLESDWRMVMPSCLYRIGRMYHAAHDYSRAEAFFRRWLDTLDSLDWSGGPLPGELSKAIKQLRQFHQDTGCTEATKELVARLEMAPSSW